MRNTHLVCHLPAAFGLAALSANACADPRVSGRDLAEPDGWRMEVLVEGLEHPWAADWLPDGTMLVTERPGRLRVVRDGVLLSTPVSGVPPVLAQGQGGLLDVSVHPGFEETGWIYLTHSAGTVPENQTVVTRGVYTDGALTNVTRLFAVSQMKNGGQHFGSRLEWLPDGTFLLSIGDGGNPPVRLDGEYIREQAQNRASHLGKVLRLNADGTPPDDNPFAGDPNADPYLWSMGHRNIQGMDWDAEREILWANEHGARGGDELNAIRGGENHGWPTVTFSVEYAGGRAISPHRTLEGYVDPLVVWTPATAPSGLLVYTGEAFPDWRGDLLSGGLVDQAIRLVELDSAGTVTGERRLPMGARVRDVRLDPDGQIIVLTDEPRGRILRIVPDNETRQVPRP